MKKKLLYLVALVGVIFAACNPLDDIKDEYDEIKDPISTNVEYTLTEADYELIADMALDADPNDTLNADLISVKHYFTDAASASLYVPDFLAGRYPSLERTSIANITYNQYVDYPEYLNTYQEAEKYELDSADYASADTILAENNFFAPTYPAATYMNDILAAAMPDAQDGDVYLVEYMYSDEDPEINQTEQPVTETIFEENWDVDTTLGDFSQQSVIGDDQTWYRSEYSGDGYAKMSGFDNGVVINEDWLVTPAFNLAGYDSYTMQFSHAAKYVDGRWDLLNVFISTDYDGADVTTATWNAVTVPTWPAGDSYDYSLSGEIDLTSYAGSSVYVGFKYEVTDTVSPVWQITDFNLSGTKMAKKSKSMEDAYEIAEYYTLDDATWELVEEAYYLNAADYDAMGAPGAYNNFSSSAAPEDYLPSFLTGKYPYAQTGDMMVIVYKYYNDGVSTIAEEYSFDGTNWAAYNPVVVQSDQFIHNGDAWMFDPAVNVYMEGADYQLIVDYVKANHADEDPSTYDNTENYFGSSAYYGNFDIRDGKFNEKFGSWEEAVIEGILVGLLPTKYPDAVDNVSGVPVEYIVHFATYSGAAGNYNITYLCTKSGPNPEFEFVAGPVAE